MYVTVDGVKIDHNLIMLLFCVTTPVLSFLLLLSASVIVVVVVVVVVLWRACDTVFTYKSVQKRSTFSSINNP